VRVFPRAWLAAPIALDSAAAVAAIRDARLPGGRRFDARTQATTESTESGVAIPGQSDGVRVVDEQPSRMTLATHCARPCFLVVRDAFDPQWRARIDGAAGRIVPADLALRGITVPAGDHTVTLIFVPSSLYLGLALCALAAILSAVLILWESRARAGRLAATA
jgi:hypothetical protein